MKEMLVGRELSDDWGPVKRLSQAKDRTFYALINKITMIDQNTDV